MITEEQIKNLKDGDTIYLNHYPLTFKDVSDDLNTISARDDASTCGEGDLCWFTRQYLTLQPKYDPCRPFKNGDIVRYVERDGRSYVDAPPVGATCCVCVGEDSVGMVSVEFKFSENEEPAVHDVPFYHLELVTPVEELEPYKVWDTTFSFNVGVEDSKAVFYYGADMSTCPYTKEQAKAAAEAERDRLNAEWRKEQNNDK